MFKNMKQIEKKKNFSLNQMEILCAYCPKLQVFLANRVMLMALGSSKN